MLSGIGPARSREKGTTMLHSKPLASIGVADLEALVTYEISEGRALDYKRDMLFAKPDDRKELARDTE